MECISLIKLSPPLTFTFLFFGTGEYWKSLTEEETFSISAYKDCLSFRAVLVTARLGNPEMPTKFRILMSLEGLILLHSFCIGVFVLMTIIISILTRLGNPPPLKTEEEEAPVSRCKRMMYQSVTGM